MARRLEEDKFTFSSNAHTVAEMEREETPAVLPRGAATCLAAGSSLPNSFMCVSPCLLCVHVTCECLVFMDPDPL